jgi:hypothetical protein
VRFRGVKWKRRCDVRDDERNARSACADKHGEIGRCAAPKNPGIVCMQKQLID